MVCDLRCGHNLLIEECVAPAQLVSMTALRTKLTEKQVDKIRNYLLALPEFGAGELRREVEHDPAAAYIKYRCIEGSLRLYVINRQTGCQYRIRPEAIRVGCCSWSPYHSIVDGHLRLTRSRMLHQSPEALSDGLALYVWGTDADEYLRCRPTPVKQVRKIINAVIEQAVADGEKLSNDEIKSRVQAHPDISKTSARQILGIARKCKPADWKRSGPKRRSVR